MSPRRHKRVRSEMVRIDDGPPRFQPRCSCGWIGEPVDAGMVVIAFEAHREKGTPVLPEEGQED